MIGALREIGSIDTLAKLEKVLFERFRSIDCLMAIGKIGSITSVPNIMLIIMPGSAEQKEAPIKL